MCQAKAGKSSPLYQPLHTEKKEIRLLILSPSTNHDAPLKCSLRTVSLSNHPDFDALSYLWGDPRPDHRVFIDSHELGITRNAFHALMDLRLDSAPVCIWIDGICIDQSNLDERARQVLLMRDIYSRARVVRIWIDEEMDPESPVLDAMNQMKVHGCRLGQCKEHSEQQLSFWECAFPVLRNAYWERVWIQQEILLASDIKIHCRRACFDGQPWLNLQYQVCSAFYGMFTEEGEMFDITTKMRERYQDYPLAVTLRGTIYDARELLREHRSGPLAGGSSELLLDLFYQAYALQATDIRDKLYGILGFIDPLPGGVTIDYNLSVIQVYSQLFKYVLDEGQCLEFLCFNPTRDASFPSWFPCMSRDGISRWDMASTHSACANIKPTAEISSSGNILQATGFKVETITSRTEHDLIQDPGSKWIIELRDICERACLTGGGDVQSKMAEIAFWWTRLGHYKNLPILSTSVLDTSDVKGPDEQKRLAWETLSAALEQAPNLTLRDLVIGGSDPGINSIAEAIPGIQYTAITLYLRSFVYAGASGLLGLAPDHVDVGDEIWILFGCRLPVVLRRREGVGERYRFVGPGIIPGIMEGEACADFLSDSLPAAFQVIEIS